MFYKHNSEGKVAILIVNVNDIILIGNDNEELERKRRDLNITSKSRIWVH